MEGRRRGANLGNRDDIQKLINQEARASMGAFRTTNTGAIRPPPAAAQLNNRKSCFALRLVRLPKGDQAKELVGAANSHWSQLWNPSWITPTGE